MFRDAELLDQMLGTDTLSWNRTLLSDLGCSWLQNVNGFVKVFKETIILTLTFACSEKMLLCHMSVRNVSHIKMSCSNFLQKKTSLQLNSSKSVSF